MTSRHLASFGRSQCDGSDPNKIIHYQLLIPQAVSYAAAIPAIYRFIHQSSTLTSYKGGQCPFPADGGWDPARDFGADRGSCM